jgi:hypothetical protein
MKARVLRLRFLVPETDLMIAHVRKWIEPMSCESPLSKSKLTAVGLLTMSRETLTTAYTSTTTANTVCTQYSNYCAPIYFVLFTVYEQLCPMHSFDTVSINAIYYWRANIVRSHKIIICAHALSLHTHRVALCTYTVRVGLAL